MFASDQPKISAYARASAENMARVYQFVVLTVQTPLARVVNGDIDLAAEGGPDAMGVLYGWKLNAYATAWADREEIYHNLEDMWCHRESDRSAADRMLVYLSSFPGLGFAKAGFVLQLAYGVSGCLDTHNLTRFGIPANYYSKRHFNKKPQSRLVWARRYNDHIEQLGGTAKLWDTWCEYVANSSRYRQWYDDARHVSRMHCAAFGLD